MGGEEVRKGDNRKMQLHFEEVTLQLKADIYRDKDQSQYSHFMFGEYWVKGNIFRVIGKSRKRWRMVKCVFWQALCSKAMMLTEQIKTEGKNWGVKG